MRVEGPKHGVVFHLAINENKSANVVYIRASSLENCMQRKCAFTNQLVYLTLPIKVKKDVEREMEKINILVPLSLWPHESLRRYKTKM